MTDPIARRTRTGSAAGITGLRLTPPGAEARLVNISPTGVLAESPAKLRVGTDVDVQFHGGFTPASIAGRVVRCEVSIMERDGVLRYQIAIEFNSPIELAEEKAREPEKHEAAPPSPVRAVRNRW